MSKKHGFWFVAAWLLLAAGDSLAEEKWLAVPPASIGQWYKPQNDRQVWLHTMFNLRREMQAVAEYAAAGEPALMRQWTERFSGDYLKIAEMVPEWKDEVDYGWLKQLRSAAEAGDSEGVVRALGKIEQGCNACHREFQAVTAILYRTPDFSTLSITSTADGTTAEYGDVMEELSTLVNRIKISLDDDRQAQALDALGQLRHRLEDLGGSCSNCHKDPAPRERYLGQLTRDALQELERGVKQGDKKLAGRALGSAAVYACARCHAVHRSSYAMRKKLLP